MRVGLPRAGTSAKPQDYSEQRKLLHHCHARGCTTHCRPEYLMCPRHWRMVPGILQAGVHRHYRKGQCDDMSPSREWFTAADRAIEAVARIERRQ